MTGDGRICDGQPQSRRWRRRNQFGKPEGRSNSNGFLFFRFFFPLLSSFFIQAHSSSIYSLSLLPHPRRHPRQLVSRILALEARISSTHLHSFNPKTQCGAQSTTISSNAERYPSSIPIHPKTLHTMQLSALLLALPCLVPALARPHTLRHQVDSPHLGKREIYAATEASLSKAHLGMPPANADSLQAVAGMRQVRRKRRSMSSTCGASNSRSTGNSTTSIGEVGASVPSGTMPTTQPTQEAASPPVSDNSTWSQTGSESTSSTAASTPSTSPTSNASSSGGGGLGGLLAKLFPIGWGTSHWTTADVDDSNKLSCEHL